MRPFSNLCSFLNTYLGSVSSIAEQLRLFKLKLKIEIIMKKLQMSIRERKIAIKMVIINKKILIKKSTART